MTRIRCEVLSLDSHLLASGRRERVVTGAPVVFRRAPLGLHPSFGQQALQSRVERAFSDVQDIARKAPEPLRDRVPVQGASDKRLQGQQFERTRQQVRNRPFHGLSMGKVRRSRDVVNLVP